MHVQTRLNRSFAFLGSLVLAAVLFPAFQVPAAAQYVVTDLVSNQPGAPNHDPNLINAWGIANFPTSPFWVSDQGSGKSTLYNGAGTPIPLVVTVPPTSGTGAGKPTGMVANSTKDFVITGGGGTGAAVFIFDTEDGTISGWNGGTDAVIKVNRHSAGASYTGLAMGFFNGKYYLYAADNGVKGKVDMFDANFKFVMSFTDPRATLPPFNVQNINGYLYVTYGKPFATGGFVDIFDTGGNLITPRILSTKFNGPWGLALAPPNFGKFSSALLVGNLTDGHINAFDYRTHAFLGQLADSSGSIFIDGLWALTFGSGGAKDVNGQTNQLFFSAGPHGYEDGLFGVIEVAK